MGVKRGRFPLLFLPIFSYPMQTSNQLRWAIQDLEFPRFGSYDGQKIVSIMKEYSARHLTYESDVLHAVSGILSAYERNCAGFRHCWGVPIFENYFHDTKYG